MQEPGSVSGVGQGFSPVIQEQRAPAGVGQGFPALSAVEGSPVIQVIHGIIDLVHRADEGWRVLDYKSDQLDSLTDIDAVLIARYAPQLAQYRRAWQLASGEAVVSTELVALRAKRTIRL